MRRLAFLLFLLTVTALLAVASPPSRETTSKRPYPGGRQYIFRLTLRDKAGTPYTLDKPTRWLSHRSVERRRRQGLPIDSTDLPLSPRYMDILGAQPNMAIIGKSRWNNTVLMRSPDSTALHRLAAMDFVKQAECVWISPDSIERHIRRQKVSDHFNPWDSLKNEYYGNGSEQIEMLGGQRLHHLGLRGSGITIAVLDGGFQNAQKIPALAKAAIRGTVDVVCPETPDRGTVDGQPRMFFETDHGTKVLTVMAANEPEVLVGTAPEADFWLLRCEDLQTEQPVEEDYWAMAAELADSVGVDIINSSLGYHEYDKPMRPLRLRDLDGRSTLISRTASMLAAKGIVLVSSAGNNGMGAWKKICVPADASDILTVGAVNSDGQLAPFSSVGPSQDNRVKPDVMALGAPAAVITGRGNVIRDMGTSFSTPVVCGLVACLWQALPQKTALEIIDLVRRSSNNFDTPDNVYGYGIPNFWQAYMIGKTEADKP